MDKVEVYNRFVQVEQEFQHIGNQFVSFYTAARLEISNEVMKLIESAVTAIIKNSNESLDDHLIKSLERYFDIEKIASLPKYSLYNPLVRLKFLKRNTNKLLIKEYEYHRQLRGLLKEIKAIEISLKTLRLKSKGTEKFKEFTEIKYRINRLLDYDLRKEIDFYKLFPIMFAGKKLDKNHFLSLINVNHDLYHWDGTKNNTMNYIRELPDKIDFKTFYDAIFVHKIEHDLDNCFFEILMKEHLDLIEQGKIKPFNLLEKIIGQPIPTYTVAKDIYGDIVAIESNKPNLSLIKGEK